MANRKGFLSSLFDFSFTEFVSPAVLKVLYGVFLFGLGMSVFFLLYVWYQTLFQTHWRTGEWDPELDVFFGSLFAYPLFVFVYLLLGRVIFERGILAFRQYELTRELVELMRDRTER